jgi:hypothetical protein
MTTRTVPGFLPSTSGLRFGNSFPRLPLRRLGIPGVLSLGIGDASNGLCGGMAFAARDYFEVDRAPPPTTTAPTEGPLFDYLVDRLFDSFDLPLGPLRYLQLMNPMLPDGETVWSRLGLAPHGRVWRTRMLEWPRIRADIDAGHPCPLGLVRVKSTDPFALKHNHQVLAYGYEIHASSFTLHLYDPNLPNRDDVTLTLSWASPHGPISWFPPGVPVHAFFRLGYRSSEPPEV